MISSDNEALYRALYRIRRFEETVLENFSHGLFYGTTHTYIGQEANAVGVLNHIRDEDVIFSNHRGHGHFLAYGGDMRALFAELMGKATGVCGGRGGSQHLQWRNFFSNGVQGGTIPVATGAALAEKFKNHNSDNPSVTIAFLGDGTLGEGVIYEAFNMASLWSAPIFFVLENNRIAQTTPIELAVAGEVSSRFKAFDIPTDELDTSDVLEILPLAGELLAEVRNHASPRALILNTCRLGPHSKGDDTRSQEVINALRSVRDPIEIHAQYLSPGSRHQIEADVEAEVRNALELAMNDPQTNARLLASALDSQFELIL
jgi:TPP-dependent pyruvate/acetoin dehydrogenase alpha subunit